MTTILRCAIAMLAMGAASLASALPVSSCVNNAANAGITCNIYESDAQGNPSETSNVVTIPQAVVSGFIVVLEAGGTIADPTTWSDVVEIFNDVTSATGNHLQLFSGDGHFGAGFVAMVQGNPNATIFENPLGTADTNPTVYTAGINVYNIFSGPAAVPEPATILLLGIGMLAVGLRRKLR